MNIIEGRSHLKQYVEQIKYKETKEVPFTCLSRDSFSRIHPYKHTYKHTSLAGIDDDDSIISFRKKHKFYCL